ncbi:DUF2117 domain-containing protein [Methanobrevibacter sp. OttesenSCG-928-K11]|nr:DUF2117 domain-containing protein [Methanobrevibacter sp. OttesenSCG-928-K11]
MEIGIVVHGPNIIDSGYAIKIISFLKDWGNVEAKLGGTMGRTAVIDAALENEIDISSKLLPSESLEYFNKKNVDVIFLLNYGKSSVTGHVFGYKVFNHYIQNIKNNSISIIQIERPGDSDGSLINWNNEKNNEVSKITNELIDNFKLKQVNPSEIEDKHFNSNNNSKFKRIIHGVSPNENILVNGIVVGKSKSSEIALISKEGYLTEIEGGLIKEHGALKLGKLNLNKAIVKTGLLRNSIINPRKIENDADEDQFKVAFLDHAAYDVYKFKDMDLVVTVGDDTTLLAGDILYRYNIPIIGITDGDLDKVVKKGFKTNDSFIFEVESGFDDIIGEKVFKEIFKNSEILKFSLNDYNKESFKNKKINEIKSCIIKIINNMNI